jgi:hypothetical protein
VGICSKCRGTVPWRKLEATTWTSWKSLHASAVKDRATWAFSSVGESARLITVRSLVRIQKGPRSGARTAGPAHGDVAQLGEHLLCKQGVAGSSPAISTCAMSVKSNCRLSRPPHLDNGIASLREKQMLEPCSGVCLRILM